MANRLLRRSGIAIALIAELIDWKPDAIFQVGVGVYHKETEVFKEAWPDATLIGFEPHPDVRDEIERVDPYPGTLHPFALGKKEEERCLYYTKQHLDAASFCDSRDGVSLDAVSVRVRTLDSMFLPAPDAEILLWLDCEGAELEVLEGAEKFVENVDVINVELTSNPDRRDWPRPVEVNRWLLDHGFLNQYVHTHRSSMGQNDMVYVTPELFRPEFCSCPLQVEDWERRYK